ncbi:MAG TPA: FAD:protein FMN transferase [Candidatus Polarisedimenticolaceae bacterium]|nr:FAD:protein FMN transferase [Candidatus Polarisedimenticolaceae bacterium]
MRRVLAFSLVLFCGCAELYFKDQPLTRRWPVMGTYAEATVWGDGPVQARAMEHLRDSLDRSDAAMSNWRADSGLNQLNRDARAGEALAADPVLAECVAAALDGAEATGGAFDPTVGPLMVVWGLRPGPRRTPDDAEIEATLRDVGWEKVQRQGRKIRFQTRGMELDLGGIGKGCALDAAVREAMLDTPAGILDLGRSFGVWGFPPHGSWHLAITAPEDEEDVFATLTVEPPAYVSTSSQEENPGHIVDPKTGRAADTDIVSATAIAPTGAVSDLLSTALLVAGSGHARGILEAYPGAHAVLLVREGGALTLLASASLEKRLKVEEAWQGRLASVEYTLP